MRLALIADIHGNLPALEAVAAELERLQPDAVLLAGDLINAVPFSGPVIDFVRAQDWQVIRGNHEFYYLNFGTERDMPGSADPERWGQLHWLVEHITDEQGRYLAQLADDLRLFYPGTQPLRLAHGVPGHNRRGFYTGQTDDEIVPAIEHVPEATLISAHTHIQIDRVVAAPPADNNDFSDPHAWTHPAAGQQSGRRWHLINPGSVGMPLNGDPRAQFALLESVSPDELYGGWRVMHHRLEYDRRPALAAYERSGMLAAGGVISRMFYWEIVTAQPEISHFYRWAREHFPDPDSHLNRAFAAYIEATGRDQFVRGRDPLYQRM